mgnify:CR=1 FL=1
MEGHSISGESRKNGWVEQKKELTKVLKIAWPAVFESFFISLAGMIDVYMVSGLGSEAVASVGLTTRLPRSLPDEQEKKTKEEQMKRWQRRSFLRFSSARSSRLPV